MHISQWPNECSFRHSRLFIPPISPCDETAEIHSLPFSFFAEQLFTFLTLCAVTFYASATNKIECPHDGVAFIQHPKSCSRYYICMGGKPVEQQCAEGLLFDTRARRCNVESNVKCVLDVCPADSVGVVTMVPHPEDCAK